VRIRSGTDIPFLFGVLYHVFNNGWEDKRYIEDRVYGMDKVRDEVMKKWTPDKVAEVTGVAEADLVRAKPEVLAAHHDDAAQPGDQRFDEGAGVSGRQRDVMQIHRRYSGSVPEGATAGWGARAGPRPARVNARATSAETPRTVNPATASRK